MLKLGALVQFCPLLGVKRTLVGALHMSANDPKRTSRVHFKADIQNSFAG